MIATVAAASLLAASCGGGSNDDAQDDEAQVTTTEADQATSAATNPPATDPPATDPPVTEPVTTDPPVPEVPEFELDTLPGLIDEAVQATSDPSISPLSIAQQLIGFPIEIPVPAGSTLLELSADPWFSADGVLFDFTYHAVAPGGAVPDIDINADDSGPGSVQVTEIWDPIMTALGFERNGRTGSDPGDPGGPNSVNHVYIPADPIGFYNGVPGELDPVLIWSSEDINGWAYSAEREELAGYTIDIGIETAPGAGVPIPLVNALLEQFPIPDGLTLNDTSVDLRSRPESSFDADKGLFYVDVYIEWTAPAGMFDAVVEFYSDTATIFTDPATLMAGEDDFFNQGTIEFTEWYTYGDADQRLEILLLQRYGGSLGIEVSPDGTTPMTLSFDLELNHIAPPLALPEG
jgi:hypothetical protein